MILAQNSRIVRVDLNKTYQERTNKSSTYRNSK